MATAASDVAYKLESSVVGLTPVAVVASAVAVTSVVATAVAVTSDVVATSAAVAGNMLGHVAV